MRLPLIILASTLAFTACNKSENHIKPRPYIVDEKKAEPVIIEEQKAVEEKAESAPAPLVLGHAKGQSVLHDKLLNRLINNHLEKKSLKLADDTLKMEDEYSFKDKSNKLTLIESSDYNVKSKQLARVVISYTDQVMVFFLKPGLKINSLKEILGLKEEPAKALVQLGSKEGELKAGHAVYFVSTDRKEVFDYDRAIYNETFHYGKFSDGLNLRLNSNQLVEAYVNYDYKVQTAERTVFSKQGTCGRSVNNCSPCKWIRPVPSSVMLSEQPATVEALGMQVRINDVLLTIPEWKLTVKENQLLKLFLSAPENYTQSSYTAHFSFSENSIQRSTVLEPGSAEGNSCSSLYIEILRPVLETFKTKTYATLKLVVWGHGDVMNDLKLD